MNKGLNYQLGYIDLDKLLYCAVSNGYVEQLAKLLTRGATVHYKDKHNRNRTSLHLASSKEIAEILIQNGANVNSTDNNDNTPLHMTEDIEVAKSLIQNGANVNSKNSNNHTPLHVTTNKEIAEILIQNGADLNSKDINKKTPLHVTNNKDVAEILIQNGANVNSRDRYNQTPLHLTKNKEIAEILIQSGADVNSRDIIDDSPLHSAVSCGKDSMVEILVSQGANVSALNRKNCTPLHVAVSNRDRQVIDVLLSANANVNAIDDEKWTPLHLAASEGYSNVTIVLVNANANVYAINNEGKTPCDLAEIGCRINNNTKSRYEYQKTFDYLKGKMDMLGSCNEQSSAINNSKTASSIEYSLQNKAESADTNDKNIQLPWLVDAIEFQRMLSRGEYLSYENRLSLGGPCRAGKSTLASILIGQQIPLQWNSTDGLVIYFGRNGIDIDKQKMVPLQKGERGHEVLAKILRGMPNVETNSEQIKIQKTTTTIRSVNTEVQALLTAESPTKYTKDNNKTIKYSTDQFATKANVAMNKHVKKHFGGTQMPRKGMPSATTEIQTLDCKKMQLQSDILEEVRNGQYKIKIAPSDLIDFGGQKSYDMTHQLFIQHRGSFLLMFDGRFGLHKQLEEYPQGVTAASILKLWVDSVLTYAEDTDDIMPMILFAATHRDQCKEDVTKMRNDFIQDIKQIFSNHDKKHHIHLDTVYFINGIDKHDVEIQLMTDQIVSFAIQQSSWGQRRPMQWVPLELQISKMRIKNVNIITKEDLQNINKLNDDLTLSDDQLDDFLLVQHSLGKLMYYNLPGLDNFIIIHPPALVNILRSFVTDEKFFPADQNLKFILQTLTQTGKIFRTDLLKLWQQDQFHQYMQDDSIKEFVIQLLSHLDILIVPKALKQSSSDVYLVPCMIKTLRPDFYYLRNHGERTICLEYSLAQDSIPSALAYKVIGAAIITWPLKEENRKPCLYHKAAVLNVTEDDELHIWLEDNRVMVYLTNQKSLLSISPDVAASVQECLTKNIEMSLLFYFNSFGKKIKPTKVLELYTLALGVPCGTGVCFRSARELNEGDFWKCDNDKRHATKYLLYWIFDKSQNMCAHNCKGLSNDELRTEPSDKHLVRMGSQIGIQLFEEFFIHLGMTTRQWENTVDLYGGHSREGIMSMALVKWKESKLSDFEEPTLKDLTDALAEVNLDKHAICQVFREDTKLPDITDCNLQQTPSDDVLKELSNRVGNCALQLGIELGVSFNEVENSFVKFPKDLPGLIEDILIKWKAKSKIKTFCSLMLALKRVNGGGVTYLHKMSKMNNAYLV